MKHARSEAFNDVVEPLWLEREHCLDFVAE